MAGGGVGVTCATRPGRDPRNSHDGKTVTILHISFCQSDHHNSILKQKKVLYYLIFFSGLSVYPQVLILRLLAPSWWWMFFGTKLIGSFHWRNGLDVIEKKNKKQTKYSDSREFTPFYTSPPSTLPSSALETDESTKDDVSGIANGTGCATSTVSKSH